MPFKVSIKVKDLATPMLNRIKRGAKGVVARAFGEYLIGDRSRGLKHDEPYKHISRRSVYGRPFFSMRQQRAFFAKLKSGEINVPYIRTGRQSEAWHLEGASTNVRIVNRDPSVGFTRGQTALHARMGRRTVDKVIADSKAGATRHAQAEFNKWVRTQK